MNGDEPVGRSPFICNIYDVSKVLVTGLGCAKVILFFLFHFSNNEAFINKLSTIIVTGWPVHNIHCRCIPGWWRHIRTCGDNNKIFSQSWRASTKSWSLRCHFHSSRSRASFCQHHVQRWRCSRYYSPLIMNCLIETKCILDSSWKGSPFKCEITDDGEAVGMASRELLETKQATANGDGLKEVALGAPAFFEVDTHGIDGLVDVRIIGKCWLIIRGCRK